MTFVKGVYGAVDNVAAVWQNDIEDIRAMLYEFFGRSQGVLRGFVMTPNGASLAVDFTAGAAIVEQRGTDITGDAKGYFLYADTTTTVTFAAPSASSRNDAVVFCWGDPQYGSLGASVPAPGGPQIVIVQGVSGSTTPRTDAQIQTAIGVGGWFRYADVIIAPGNTTVAPGNITDSHPIVAGTSITPKRTKITASGSFTRSTDPAPRWIRVRGCGGGGAGGGAAVASSGQHTKGSGGGAGGYFEKIYAGSALNATTTVTIGAGGTGVAGAAGNAGGATTFAAAPGSLVGNGGASGSTAGTSAASFGIAGGAGGTATGGDDNRTGDPGGFGYGDAALAASGNGGSNPLGSGGVGISFVAASNQAPGNPGTGNGGGGSGAVVTSTGTPAQAGGAGSAGVVIVEEFFS